MSDSRLIELSYFAPNAKTRLTAYADTIMIDRDGKDSTITAIRFGGYPEMVRAMSDAIYGGGTIEAKRNGLTRMEATKLSITGHMYFVPRTHMDKVDMFEEFIKLLGQLNRRKTPLMVNSFYIIDDEKQRANMTEEFYAVVKKEIAEYQERADYFIKSGSQSPAVMERWVLKIQALEEKRSTMRVCSAGS